MIKKPNYLTFGRAVLGLNVYESKLSSMLALREELKERKCEIVDLNYVEANSR